MKMPAAGCRRFEAREVGDRGGIVLPHMLRGRRQVPSPRRRDCTCWRIAGEAGSPWLRYRRGTGGQGDRRPETTGRCSTLSERVRPGLTCAYDESRPEPRPAHDGRDRTWLLVLARCLSAGTFPWSTGWGAGQDEDWYGIAGSMVLRSGLPQLPFTPGPRSPFGGLQSRYRSLRTAAAELVPPGPDPSGHGRWGGARAFDVHPAGVGGRVPRL